MDLARTATRAPALTPRRNGASLEDVRTLSERIADRVGIAIVNGEYSDGEHIPEQKLAAQFGVSHGPVREALRLLGQRGLVHHQPRRGAYAIAVTIDSIADIFNVRSVLFGLAARNLALRSDAEAASLPLLQAAQRMQEAASDARVKPLEYTRLANRTARALVDNSGNAMVARTLREQGRGSLWAILWNERALDFLTEERRHAAAADWMFVADAAAAGSDVAAEKAARKALFNSRDAALETLSQIRRQTADKSKFVPD